MSWSRRRVLGTLAAGATLGHSALDPGALRAETYPTRLVRLIVPFSPGGTVDLIGRMVGKKLTETLGQPVVVDNRGGASGAIGTVAAAQAAPDGYTLLVGSTTTITILPQLKSTVGYDPLKDFVPLTFAAYVPHLLVVHPSLPVKTVPELVAFAKAQREPLTVADGGIGTPHYLALEIFKRLTGIEVLHVPYKGGGAVLADLLSGQIQAATVEQTVATPFVESGQLRPLGISTATRSPLLPTLPTVAEQGVPGYETISWFGFFAPAKTPSDIVAQLSAKMAQAVQADDTRAALTKVGATPVGSTGVEFSRLIDRELAKWGDAIKASGVRLED
jgi:tripartite-type tricarboxylate transporter receptor subunit TctC